MKRNPAGLILTLLLALHAGVTGLPMAEAAYENITPRFNSGCKYRYGNLPDNRMDGDDRQVYTFGRTVRLLGAGISAEDGAADNYYYIEYPNPSDPSDWILINHNPGGDSQKRNIFSDPSCTNNEAPYDTAPGACNARPSTQDAIAGGVLTDRIRVDHFDEGTSSGDSVISFLLLSFQNACGTCINCACAGNGVDAPNPVNQSGKGNIGAPQISAADGVIERDIVLGENTVERRIAEDGVQETIVHLEDVNNVFCGAVNLMGTASADSGPQLVGNETPGEPLDGFLPESPEPGNVAFSARASDDTSLLDSGAVVFGSLMIPGLVAGIVLLIRRQFR
jgi:hypothetical protein